MTKLPVGLEVYIVSVLGFNVYAYVITQEEIKIISTDVFVNPYAESDEEEEEKANEDTTAKDEDNVSFGLLMQLLLPLHKLSTFRVITFLC